MGRIKKSNTDDVRMKDSLSAKLLRDDGSYFSGRRKGPCGAPPMKVISNVHVQLKDPETNESVEERKSHNVFLNYGRDWLAHLIAFDSGYVAFHNDRIRYMAFGIGGDSQLVPSATIRTTYSGFPNDWLGGAGSGDPAQIDTDPSITALEWPVEVTSGVYYDNVAAPATFPGTGIVRFTAVAGINEISFGTYTSVPISEIGLFISSIPDLSVPPVVAGTLPTEKYMVAYNTFDTLSKTSSFVLQVDWELRIS